jgi:hypothetical protein
MEIVLGLAVIFCVWGCGATCWHLGHRVGIENAVQHMMDQGMLPNVEPD